MLISLIVGAILGFATATYVDYKDDGEIFNGSVAWYDYLGSTIVGGAIGASFGYMAPAIAEFAATSFTIGSGLTISAGGTAAVTAGLTITGTEILIATGLIGTIYLFASNNRPGNNRAQNKQLHDAMRHEGLDPNLPKTKDLINRIETYIRRKKLDLGWKELIDLIRKFLR